MPGPHDSAMPTSRPLHALYMVIRVALMPDDLRPLPSSAPDVMLEALCAKGLVLDPGSALRVWTDSATRQRVWEETIYLREP